MLDAVVELKDGWCGSGGDGGLLAEGFAGEVVGEGGFDGEFFSVGEVEVCGVEGKAVVVGHDGGDPEVCEVFGGDLPFGEEGFGLGGVEVPELDFDGAGFLDGVAGFVDDAEIDDEGFFCAVVVFIVEAGAGG